MRTANWCCDRSFRFDVRIDAGHKCRQNYPVCLRVDFQELMGESGTKGAFDRGTVAVVRVNPATGDPLTFDDSYPDERRFHVPHRLFWDHQNQDTEEKVAWILEDPSGMAEYSVYFGAVGGDHDGIDFGTRAIGAGEPLICTNAPLNVGFWSTPAAVNWGTEGKLDLVVGTVSNRSMLRYYENVGTRETPLFDEGVRLRSGGSLIAGTQPCAVDWDGDGIDDLLVMVTDAGRWDGKVLVLYQKAGRGRIPELNERHRIELDVNEFGGVVSFATADWDSDGLWDLVVARANKEGECRFFFHKNVGDRGSPSFAEPKIISIDGEEMMSERNRSGMVSIAISDWLGDGRPHLLAGVGGDKDGKVLLLENMAFGDGGEPGLADGRPLTLADGTDLTLPRSVLANPIIVDWDGSGRRDVLAGSHRGLLYHFRDNSTRGRWPALRPAETIKLRRGKLSAGSFATPALSDWNGDGNLDIVIGGEYGQLTYFENAGDRANPIFECRGEIRAGDNTPRSPGAHLQEADEFWGYTSPIAIDWDGDGKDDLIVGESIGFHTYYRCLGVEDGVLRFEDGVRLEGDGKAVRSAWRIKPALWPVHGRRDIILSDTEGYAVRYRDTGRKDRPVFENAGRLVLENGQEFRPFSAGGNNPLGGRTRYVAVDWNGDGLLDLLITNNEATVGSGILYYENSGTNEDPVFFRRLYLMANGREIRAGSGHAANHCPTDWFGTGLTDLMVGNDDGFLHLYRNSFFEAPPEIAVSDVVAR